MLNSCASPGGEGPHNVSRERARRDASCLRSGVAASLLVSPTRAGRRMVAPVSQRIREYRRPAGFAHWRPWAMGFEHHAVWLNFDVGGSGPALVGAVPGRPTADDRPPRFGCSVRTGRRALSGVSLVHHARCRSGRAARVRSQASRRCRARVTPADERYVLSSSGGLGGPRRTTMPLASCSRLNSRIT